MNSSPAWDPSGTETRADLRIEYAALSNTHNAYVGFRLTLLGFFVAAVALIAINHKNLDWPTFLLGALMTLALWMFELRTQIIYRHLAHRGIDIEQQNWDYKNRPESPLFSRLFPDTDRAKAGEAYPPANIFTLRFTPPKWLSHSNALSVLYVSVLLYFLSLLTLDLRGSAIMPSFSLGDIATFIVSLVSLVFAIGAYRFSQQARASSLQTEIGQQASVANNAFLEGDVDTPYMVLLRQKHNTLLFEKDFKAKSVAFFHQLNVLNIVHSNIRLLPRAYSIGQRNWAAKVFVPWVLNDPELKALWDEVRSNGDSYSPRLFRWIEGQS